MNVRSEVAAFEWQQPRSNTIKSCDLNCFTKFKGVPNHITSRVLIRCVYSLHVLCCTAGKFHRSSVLRVLPWGLTFILGVGPNFHASKQRRSGHAQLRTACLAVRSVHGISAKLAMELFYAYSLR